MLDGIMKRLGYVPARGHISLNEHRELIEKAQNENEADVLEEFTDWLGKRIDHAKERKQNSTDIRKYREKLTTRMLRARMASR